MLSYCSATIRTDGSAGEAVSLDAPDLDEQIEAAAAADDSSYSAWLAGVARKELLVRAGLDAVAEFELAEGSFTEVEKSDARAWAADALERSKNVGTAPRRSA